MPFETFSKHVIEKKNHCLNIDLLLAHNKKFKRDLRSRIILEINVYT
jgi:hypothetical protein